MPKQAPLTAEKALALAKGYAEVRKPVRRALIAEARRLVVDWDAEKRRLYSSLLRKLHSYPSDLNDERLIAIVEGSLNYPRRSND